MNNNYPIVLIVHPGTLGDVLLAVEAIREIRSAFPSHQVVWVGQSEVGKFLLACEEVNEIIGIEGPFLSKLLAHPKHLDDQLQNTLERCTHCVGWMTDHDEILSNVLKFFGIRCIFQSPQSSMLADFHQEERFVKTLQPWGITANSQKKRLPLLPNVRHPFQSDYLASKFGFIDTPYIVIHPGSGSLHKCVNASLLGEIVGRLLNHPLMNLVILSGPADQSQVSNFLNEIEGGDYHLVSNQSLSTVSMILKNAALYVGHDSGISHLAAGVGTPSIVLFGPTNSAFWAPKGDHVAVMQGPACQCADWKQVQQCQLKPCLEMSVDHILQKAEQGLPLEGRFQISDLKSQIKSNNQDCKFQTVGL